MARQTSTYYFCGIMSKPVSCSSRIALSMVTAFLISLLIHFALNSLVRPGL